MRQRCRWPAPEVPRQKDSHFMFRKCAVDAFTKVTPANVRFGSEAAIHAQERLSPLLELKRTQIMGAFHAVYSAPNLMKSVARRLSSLWSLKQSKPIN